MSWPCIVVRHAAASSSTSILSTPTKIPKLPPAKRNTKPFQSELITQWGESVTPQNAWTEYPRPQLQREAWQNLNGHWDYAITPAEQTDAPKKWAGKILVPYCLESRLGGVRRLLDPDEALWYRRSFEAAPSAQTRTLLNFEAVDYRCEVFVNGQSVGAHQGGNTPFSLDVTEAIRDGQNELIVRVEDDTEGWQLRGKQVLNARGIWYTQVSGIWQTVWLEQVASNYIEDLKIATDAAAGTITVRPVIKGGQDRGTLRVVVRDGQSEVGAVEGNRDRFTITIANAKTWSPDSPHLYDLQVTLSDARGKVVDRVKSYAGIRTVGKTRDKDGHWRFTLNGKTIFHWGPLDQGWWPDGLLTPPSDEAMLFDIEWLKSAGFNMIRKHIKVEPRRYYYHCDRLGMMVWQDQVSGGEQPPWTRLKPNPADAEWPQRTAPAVHARTGADDRRAGESSVDRRLGPVQRSLGPAPHNGSRQVDGETRSLANWSTSPAAETSGRSETSSTPISIRIRGFRSNKAPADVSTTISKSWANSAGTGYPVKGHLWDANRRNWGYGGLPANEAEYKQRYVTSLNMLNAASRPRHRRRRLHADHRRRRRNQRPDDLRPQGDQDSPRRNSQSCTRFCSPRRLRPPNWRLARGAWRNERIETIDRCFETTTQRSIPPWQNTMVAPSAEPRIPQTRNH